MSGVASYPEVTLPKVDLPQDILVTLPKTYIERRTVLLRTAKFAEHSDRFEEMCRSMKAVVLLDSWAHENQVPGSLSLNVDERNLLSVAYKNIVSSRRSSWRSLQAARNEDSENWDIITRYMMELENELKSISSEILFLLTEHLIPYYYKSGAISKEYGVFYLKMAGDYYRYLAEISERGDPNHTNARNYYQEALDLADSDTFKGPIREGVSQERMPSTHPVRLGLALNFSVCYYETLGQLNQAVELARKTFDDALDDLDFVSEQSYKDAVMILQLLKDNLSLWTRE